MQVVLEWNGVADLGAQCKEGHVHTTIVLKVCLCFVAALVVFRSALKQPLTTLPGSLNVMKRNPLYGNWVLCICGEDR